MESENTEPVSAFSMYKRKSAEQSLRSTKRKCNHSLESNAASQKIVAENTIKDTLKKRQSKRKCTLNVAVKNKNRVVAKAGNLRMFKKNLPTVKKAQKKHKVDNMQTQLKQVVLTNDIPSAHKKSKLKEKKVESKVDKEKGKVSFHNGEARESPTQSHQVLGNNSSFSYSDDAKDTDYDDLETLDNPIENSGKIFEWLISPVKMEDFFIENWEKTPVHIKRNNPSYYEFLMSTPLLDQVLREHNIIFGKNIDITSYTDGVRETHNPAGRAFPSVVWDYYRNKCSVRMLNPQTFITELYTLNAGLQELFGCLVGANSYLTPPDSQGFAPHFDDIEAFILQIEGKKRWRLYQPKETEYLARYSSKNLSQSEIGEPIFDAILNAGDLLYFPRGTIHQGTTVGDAHSLHVTLSVYQRNSWCDLFEKLLPHALERAAAADSTFRQGLPLTYLRHIGIAHDKQSSKKAFKSCVRELFSRLIDYIDVDHAADLMAKNHIHDFLPPILTTDERRCSILEDGDAMVARGVMRNCSDITLETRVRLTRSHCIRLIKENGIYKTYYSTENSKEYHEYEPQFLEVCDTYVSAIKKIIMSYPRFIRVNELPVDTDDKKIQLVVDLWEKALVITDVPLTTPADK